MSAALPGSAAGRQYEVSGLLLLIHTCLVVQAADGPIAGPEETSETTQQQDEDATAGTTERSGAGDETDALSTESTQLPGQP